jgi:predicted nucleotidyltransferase
MFYEDVFRELNHRGVRYVVVGGVALNLHGVPRTTADLDLSVAIDKNNLEKIVETLRELEFKPRVPVAMDDFTDPHNLKLWHAKKNMQVFTFWNSNKPYSEVDVFTHNPIDFEKLDRTKEIIKAGEIQIPIVSLENLIELKKLSNRQQDISDIEALLRIKKLKE